MAQENIIDKIDGGLETYYLRFGINTYQRKFKRFCENNELEEEEVKEELYGPVEDCVLTDFDSEFPLDPPIGDENEKQEEIVRILTIIEQCGSYQKIKLDLEMCLNITEKEINDAKTKYKKQMQCFANMNMSDDIKWAFAVGLKNKIPFLTYIVDSYTRDQTKQACIGKPLQTVDEWVKQNPFLKVLLQQHPKEGTKVISALHTYNKRILHRLQFDNARFKVNDNVQGISEYVATIPAFIQKLIEKQIAVPPFQVDLVIAVHGVISADTDDDKDDYVDHIGTITDNLSKYPVLHFYRQKKDDTDESGRKVEVICRDLMQRYHDFRTTLSKFNKRIGNEDDDEKKEQIAFHAPTYPQFKRFCIVLDRRNHSSSEDEKSSAPNRDEIIFFQPPDHCNTIQRDHVPEIGFDLIAKCILPKGNVQNDQSITSKHSVDGQVMTFMFNVEQANEIKCYIVWNGETMRFHGDHLKDVLQRLFTKNVNRNIDNAALSELKVLFDNMARDHSFDQFYAALKTFKHK